MGKGASSNIHQDHIESNITLDLDDDLLFSLIDELFAEIDEDEMQEDSYDDRYQFPDFVTPVNSINKFYKYQRQIGKGVSGAVYLVQSKQTHKQYALKQMLKSNLNYKSFINEIKTLKEINHPNIVNINDVYISKEHFLLSTEYCCNGSLLHRLINKQHFSEKKSANFLKQILEALEYIHSKNIAHRDLKLSNIVLDRSSKLKLIDFGQSEIITDYHKKDRNIYGSLYYLPPETARTRTKHELFAGDLWSVGVILYMMIEGVIPFIGSDVQSLIQNINDTQLEYKVPLSDDCKDLIESLLNKDITKRLTAKEALKHSWIVNRENNNDENDDTDDILAQMLTKLNFRNELQSILVHSVLLKSVMNETEEKLLISSQSLNDEELINYIISGNYKDYKFEEKSLSKVNLNDIDIDGIFAEIDSETKSENISSSKATNIGDTISIQRFIKILESSPKKYNIPQIISNIKADGSDAISFKSIALYNIPICEL